MIGAWSQPPVGRLATLSEIGPIGKKLSEHNGESRFVALLQNYLGWVYKEYLSVADVSQSQRLDQLIRLPGQMTASDKALIEAHTSWPAARVVNDWYETIGVLMPLAPEHYKTDMRLPGGRSRRMPLLVDQLALLPSEQERLLTAQSLADRIEVCASVAAVGALFERYRLVYLDWSYANIFWSLDDHSCYVIDMDGSSFGARPQIHQPGWDDPLVPLGQEAGNESDRYRVALLIARCLTGVRGQPTDTRAALNDLRQHSAPVEQVAELLIWSISAQSTRDRPPVAKISAALNAVNGRPAPSAGNQSGSVKGWKQVTPRGTATRPTAPSASTPAAGDIASSPARASQPVGTYGIPTISSGGSRPPVRSSSGSGGAVALAIVLAIIALIVLFAIFS